MPTVVIWLMVWCYIGLAVILGFALQSGVGEYAPRLTKRRRGRVLFFILCVLWPLTWSGLIAGWWIREMVTMPYQLFRWIWTGRKA